MTDAANEELEGRIVRYLDGELDEAGAAELRRELARNPAARRLLADYQADGRLAAESLDRLLRAVGGAAAPTIQARQARGRGWARWLGAAAALAAAAVVAITVAALCRPTRPAGDGPSGQRAAEVAEGQGEHPEPAWEGPLLDRVEPRPVIEGPRRRREIFDRRFFGVFDEEENKLYLLEVDDVQATVQAVSEDL